MSTSRTRAMVLLGVAFGLGIVAGGAGVTLAKKSDRGRSGSNGDCVVRHRRVCYWVGELQLTPEQQESMLGVYQDGEREAKAIEAMVRPAMDSIFQTVRPQMDSQRNALADRVRPLLTPPQRERYDSIVHAFDEQRRLGRDRNSNGPTPRDRNQ